MLIICIFGPFRPVTHERAQGVKKMLSVGFRALPQTTPTMLVTLTPFTGVWEIEDGSVEVYNVISGQPRTMEWVDTVVFASGGVPDDARDAALAERVAEVHVIGDCYQPRDIDVAVVDGHRVGRAIGHGGA